MKRVTAAVLCGFAVLALASPGSAAIRITKIYYNSPGTDTGSNASLNGEWLTIKNMGNRAKQLKGWKIRDVTGNVFRFLSFKLPARTTVKSTLEPVPTRSRATSTGSSVTTCGTTTPTRRRSETRTAPGSTPVPTTTPWRPSRSVERNARGAGQLLTVC
jgi:hypothetical protein